MFKRQSVASLGQKHQTENPELTTGEKVAVNEVRRRPAGVRESVYWRNMF